MADDVDELGYEPIETVLENVDAKVVRAIRRSDGRIVLIKLLQDGGERRRLLHERQVGSIAPPAAILRPVELRVVLGRPALIYDDFAGHPLEDELDRPLALRRALTIALEIVTALGKLHECGIVHRDLKPQHVFVDQDTREVRLTGLGLALTSTGSFRSPGEPGLIEGTFAFMAPEQTGHEGGLVDQRADLYSFGVILYRMLAGKLPLEASDALGWIHAHVAIRPPPLTELALGIPPVVSAIVEKLLCKAPEERYQTARGVIADLDRCLESVRSERAPESFTLGLRDVPDRLQIPRRLHGRESETRALRDALERTLLGRGGLVLLVGTAGVGKSVLAEMVESRMPPQGLFIRGKHEELRRDVPYFAVTQALAQLAARLLTESEERLAAWRHALRTALGANVSLLCALVPRFSVVFGDTPSAEEPAAAVSPVRFRLFFERLMEAVTSMARPVVLFLDDLQWADPASIGLAEAILARPVSDNVLLIGAYRPEEVAPGSALGGALVRLSSRERVTSITVPPLSAEAIAGFVIDAFRCSQSEAMTLACLLRERTSGNPLFVVDLLRTLDQRGLVAFDRGTGRWRWDVERIRDVPFVEKVAELILAKIGGVSPSLREALRVGACLGIEFSVTDIAAVLGRPRGDVERDLLEGARQGLLLQLSETFRFPHDRVREAAYSLVQPEERPRMHLRIGRALLGRRPGAAREEDGFAIADQLNLAATLITTPDERKELAVLDLAVGRKAKSASAYESAARYLEAGLAMLDPSSWGSDYDTAYGLHLELAACNLVLGRLESIERHLDDLVAKARTPADKGAGYCLFVDLRMTLGDVAGALKLGLEGIRACGIGLPDRTTREEAMRAVEEVQTRLCDTCIETLVELPRATHPVARAFTELVTHLGTPMFYVDPNLFGLIVSRGVMLTLEWGASEGSPPIFASFGLILGAFTGRYDVAWRFGRVAYEMAQRPGLWTQKPLVCVVFASLINYWTHHVRTGLEYLEEGRSAAYQLGDATFVCYAENHIVMTRLIMGANLEEVEAESARGTRRVSELGFDEMADLMMSRHLLISSLRGNTKELGSFTTAERDEEAFLQRIETRAPLTQCWHHIDKLQAEVFAGHFERAVDAGRKATALIHSTATFPVVGEHAFFFALALALAPPPAAAAAAAEDRALFDDCMEQLRRWSESAPENFAHKHALVSAEAARLSGDEMRAMREYERAIRSAQDNGFIQVEAIASELAARFYRERGFVQSAEAYLREARRCFAQWGATAKVKSLTERSSGPRRAAGDADVDAAATVATRPAELDLLTVTRASQALSAELVRSQLLERLLAIVLPYSGASRCCFLSAEPTPAPELELPPAREASRGLPLAVINYVRRTQERVLLHDGTIPNPFSSDPYLQARRPRALLCLPITRKKRLLGVLYLENELAPGVFSGERTTVLEILAAQTAISLDSASLFADLERENVQRRRAESSLHESRKQLEAILENLVDAVVVCDLDKRVTLVNQAAVRLFGLADRDALPTVAELAKQLRMRRPDGIPLGATELPLVRALAGEVVEAVDVDVTNLRERDLALRLSAAPVKDDRGAVVGAVEAAADMTEKVELDRLREQFVRMAAHELKTPVAVVSGYADMLRSSRQPLLPPQQRMLEGVIRGARRIDRIISDLLFMWQLRMGRLTLTVEEIDLPDLLAQAIRRCEQPATPSRVRLTTPTQVVVEGDRSLLELVFGHLIDNALRYSPGSGPVDVVVRVPESAGAEVSVTDRGIGIDPAKTARLFQPFYRAHADTANDFGGMGIGLYLSKVIVGRHGGSLTFHSELGAGSTFTVFLPKTPEVAAAPPGEAPPA